MSRSSDRQYRNVRLSRAEENMRRTLADGSTMRSRAGPSLAKSVRELSILLLDAQRANSGQTWILRCRSRCATCDHNCAHPAIASKSEITTAKAVHVAHKAQPRRHIIEAAVGKPADQGRLGFEPVEGDIQRLDL